MRGEETAWAICCWVAARLLCSRCTKPVAMMVILISSSLLAVYSAGLGLPFLLTAIGFERLQRGFGWVKRHYAAIQVLAGLVLVVMGVLVYTNELFRLNIEIQKFLDELGLNFFQSV